MQKAGQHLWQPKNWLSASTRQAGLETSENTVRSHPIILDMKPLLALSKELSADKTSFMLTRLDDVAPSVRVSLEPYPVLLLFPTSSITLFFSGQQPPLCPEKAGRWTTDVQPEGDALSSVMIPLRNDLWSFARSTLLEYLVASHVRRRVLGEAPEDGERDSTSK